MNLNINPVSGISQPSNFPPDDSSQSTNKLQQMKSHYNDVLQQLDRHVNDPKDRATISVVQRSIDALQKAFEPLSALNANQGDAFTSEHFENYKESMETYLKEPIGRNLEAVKQTWNQFSKTF